MNKEDFEHYLAQGALQQQNIEGQQVLSAPQLLEQAQQNQSALVEQTNPKKVVREILLRLRGKEELPDGTLSKIAEPKINALGQDEIWFILDSHINQNVILSHLEEKEISQIMDIIQNDLVDNLTLNWKDYGIKKKTDLDTIQNSILVNIYLALKRAEGQNEKNWLGKISVENISAGVRMPLPKRESFWGKFKL